MYQIKLSKKFVRQFQKNTKSGRSSALKIESVMDSLCTEKVLDQNLRNHRLHGKHKDLYECHIQPDLLLIYSIDKQEKVIVFLGLGSHSELFE